MFASDSPATASGSASDDQHAERLERSWFSATQAVSAARAECEALLETSERRKAEWKQARLRLLQLEELRDSLGDKLAAIDAGGATVAVWSVAARGRAKSAAA